MRAHSSGHQGRNAPSAFLTVIFFATSSALAKGLGTNAAAYTAAFSFVHESSGMSTAR